MPTRMTFVRYWSQGVCPETKWVEGSNFVDVNVKKKWMDGLIV